MSVEKKEQKKKKNRKIEVKWRQFDFTFENHLDLLLYTT
jgi:hypothetical protein